ncbi:MAG: VWA domain-containing protein, partial [Blastocatellia bacterium]
MLRFQRPCRFVLACLLLTGQIPVLSAQQPPPPKTPPPAAAQDAGQDQNQGVFRVSTQLVQIDVVVTDKKGNHVNDLSQADFELTVDGKKQDLTHFTQTALPGKITRKLPKRTKEEKNAPPGLPSAPIAPEQVRRTIALVIDDLGLSMGSMEMVRETLKKFVAEQMQEGDLVSIILTGSGVGLLEQFTSDKRILYAAIDRLRWNPFSRDMSVSFADADADETADDFSADSQAVGDMAGELRDTIFSSGTLGAVNFVVRSLHNLPGRKTVVLLSDGFRIESTTGDDDATQRMYDRLQALSELANRSSVVIYSMDARGLQPYQPGASAGGQPRQTAAMDAMRSGRQALEGPVFLSQETGGFTITDNNDLNLGIQEALYEQHSYYLLGFDPEDTKFDQKYHKIKVTMTRPGLTARTRSGFFGMNDGAPLAEKPQRTRAQQMLSSMLAPLGKRELPLRMTPFFFNASKDGPFVRVLFHIDSGGLTFKDAGGGKKQLNLDLAAFAFDGEGNPADAAANRIALSFDEAQFQQVMRDGLAYSRDFQLRGAGAYQFRAVLRDPETGRAGSASQFIQVPDLGQKRLALSGLVVTAPRESPIAMANAENNAAVSMALATARDNAMPVNIKTSPFVRNFPRTGWVQYGAGVYNAVKDKKTGKPQVTLQAEIFREGKPFRQFPVQTLAIPDGASAARFDFTGRLRLHEFPAGEYYLRVIVTDTLAKKKTGRAEQWMDFRIE